MGKLGARAVDKRMRFVTAAEAGQETMTALCRRFGLSRKTGYKWLARYRLEGIDGLIERSRAPHTHPQLVEAILQGRQSVELTATRLTEFELPLDWTEQHRFFAD